MNTSSKKSKRVYKKKNAFDAHAFLDSAGVSKTLRQFKRADIIFSQGTPADSVMYVQEGAVKITAVSEAGKEAIITILGPGDFFGEGCLAGQPVRMGNAIATIPSSLW
jgi:CRP-like cAMP-binding protein